MPISWLAMSDGLSPKCHTAGRNASRPHFADAHAGNAPHALAACRNTALTLIRRLGYKVVEGIEHFAEHRLAAVETVTGRRTE
jgi:hypothetical protein